MDRSHGKTRGLLLAAALVTALIVMWRLGGMGQSAHEPAVVPPAVTEVNGEPSERVTPPTERASARVSPPVEAVVPPPVHNGPDPAGRAVVIVRVLDAKGNEVDDAWIGLFDVEREVQAPRGPLAYFEQSYEAVVHTKTSNDGRARLVVPRAGRWRVWAGKREWTYAPGEVFQTEEPSPPVELSFELQPIGESAVVAGRVVDPNGAPVRRPIVAFFTLENEELQRWSAKPRDDGSFAIPIVRPHAAGALLVQTIGDTLGSVVLDPFSAGRPDSVVQMRPRQDVEFDLRGPAGEVIEESRVTLERWILERWETSRFGPRARRGEPTIFGLPSVPFRVSVRAQGFIDETFGPIEPADVGAVLRLELGALQRATGRVTRAGEPVGGASVWLLTRGQQATEMRLLGPTGGERRDSPPRTRTDAAGYFELPVAKSGTYDLVARKAPHGDGRLAEISIDADYGLHGLALELTAGGTIRGRLRAPVGHQPSEALISFQRPGQTFVTGVDDEGQFSAEGLTAGTWTLALLTREVVVRGSPDLLVGGRMDTGPLGHGSPPSWWPHDTKRFVELAEGATVELEWDASQPRACVLAGSVRFDGGALDPPPRARLPGGDRLSGEAFLELDGDPVARARGVVAQDGSFSLAVEQPGTYRLRVQLRAPQRTQLVMLDRVQLVPGDQPWSIDLPTGSVTVVLDDSLRARRDELVHRWHGPGELRAIARHPSGDAEHALQFFPRVPAGPGELRLEPRGGPVELQTAVDVPAGGEALVELP